MKNKFNTILLSLICVVFFTLNTTAQQKEECNCAKLKLKKDSLFYYKRDVFNSSCYQPVGFDNSSGSFKYMLNKSYKNGLLISEKKHDINTNQLLFEKFYHNNQKNGDWKTWYSNGKIKSINYYNNGNKTGKWVAYNKSGKVISETNYADNINNSEIIYEYTSNQKNLISIKQYENEKLVESESYEYKGGKLFKIKKFQIKEGAIEVLIADIEYGEEGEILQSKSYVNGKLNGEYKSYDSGYCETGNYKNGKRIGVWKKTLLTDTTIVSYIGFYKDGNKVYSANWNKEGVKTDEHIYNNDKRYYFLSWNDNGEKRHEIRYIDNKRIITYSDEYEAKQKDIQKFKTEQKQIISQVTCASCPKQILTSFITNFINNKLSVAENYLSKYAISYDDIYKDVTESRPLKWQRIKKSARYKNHLIKMLEKKSEWLIWFPRKDIARIICNPNSIGEGAWSLIYTNGGWLIYGYDSQSSNPTVKKKNDVEVQKEYRLSEKELEELTKEFSIYEPLYKKDIPKTASETVSKKNEIWGTQPVESEYGPAEGWTWHCGMVCPPDANKVSASSTLASQGKNNYSPPNIADDNPNTAWVEGKKDYGIGEYIEISDWMLCSDQKIWILNGYQSNKQTWENNSRVKKIKISFNNKEICIVELKDIMGKQEINLPIKIEESGMFRFTIIEVYPGAKYKDTAISGIFNCGG